MAAEDNKDRLGFRISYAVRILISLCFLVLTFWFGRLSLFGAGVVHFLFSIAWGFTVELRPALRDRYALSLVRTGADLFGIAIFVYITGHVESFLVVGFCVVTALSSVRVQQEIGLFAAVAGSITIAAMSALVSLGFLPVVDVLGRVDGYDRSYGILVPLTIASANFLLHRVIHRLYNRSDRLRREAEKEHERALMAMVMADRARYEVEAFADFAKRLNGSDSVSDIIHQIFDFIGENFGVEATVLFLYDQDRDELRHYQSRLPDYATEGQRNYLLGLRITRKDESIHWASLDKRRRIFVRHIRSNASPIDRGVVDTLKLHSLLIVPLVIEKDVFGLIDFSNQQRPLNLAKEDIESIETFCQQIAGAIKSSLLIEEADRARAEAEQARHELARLNAFTRQINATQNLDVILEHIFEYMETEFNIKGTWLQFIDPEAEELYTYKHTRPEGMTDEQVLFIRNLRTRLSKGGGIAWDVVRRRRSLYIPRRPKTFIYEHDRVTMETMTINSALIVPLIIADEVIAVITFTNYESSLNLKRPEIERIEGFCDQIAGAINNSHLHAESELSRMMAEQSLKEVQELKSQQDLDYYLTTNLVEPLATLHIDSETISVEAFTRQKKRFPYLRWMCEIGGDLSVAHSIRLLGRPYTVFLNADAMGKSLQGAGGVLVLGSVFRTIIQQAADVRYPYPEQWLKNAYQDLDTIFRNFQGSMYITGLVGMIDDSTGVIYYVNGGEHPLPVLFTKGQARFIQPRYSAQKLGFMLGELDLAINVARLRPGESLITGSDGRVDIMMGGGNNLENINSDEDLFLKHVEQGQGDLELIYNAIRRSGQLMDDLAMIKVTYENNLAPTPRGVDVTTAARLVIQANKLLDRKSYNDMMDLLEEPCARIIEARYCNGDELDTFLVQIITLLCRAYLESGDFEQAGRLAEEYMWVNPVSTETIYYASVARALNDDLELAADYGERVYLRARDDEKNIASLIRIYTRLRNYARASVLLSELSENSDLQLRKELIDLVDSIKP